MTQDQIQEEYRQERIKSGQRRATHVILNKKGEVIAHYIIKDGRPQYLDCWGSYSFHTMGGGRDEKVLKKLVEL